MWDVMTPPCLNFNGGHNLDAGLANPCYKVTKALNHWGRVTHTYVGNLTTTGSDNGLSPGRHQAIIWTNAGILLTGPPRTNDSEIFIEILTFPFKKVRLKSRLRNGGHFVSASMC